MSQEFYDKLWQSTTFSLSPSKLVRERWIKKLLSGICNGSGSKRIVDLGCGRGTLLQKLDAAFGNKVGLVGIDFSPAAIELNRQRFPHFSFHVRDFSTADWWKDLAKSDVVIAQEVIEHLPRESQPVFVKSLKDIALPGGHVVVTTPDWVSIQGMRRNGESDEEFARRFEGQPSANLIPPSHLDRLLRDAGLQPIFAQTVCPYLGGRIGSALIAYLYWLLPHRIEAFFTRLAWLPARYHIVVARNG